MVFKRRVSKRKPRRKAPKVSKAVKVEVAKQLSKGLENKMIMRNGNADVAVGITYQEFVKMAITADTDFRQLVPRLTDGTDAYNRVGNSITPKVLKIRGIVFINGNVIPSLDYTLRLMVVTSKLQKETTALTTTGSYYTTLLWNPQVAFPVAYLGGDPYYNQLPINRRAWNVLADKQIHLRKGFPWPGATVTSPSEGETFMSPTRSVPFEIVLTQKQLPAKFLYQAPGSDFPTNFAPVLAVGFTDNTGMNTVGSVALDSNVQIQWQSSLIYEDA